MEFNRLSAPSLKELFIKELETMILSGRLLIGSKLPPERELAKTMQVSRAVINSGITELARKGFLVIRPRIGTFVADYRRDGTLETLIAIMNYNGGILRDDEIRSILELRIALDSLAVRLSVPKITEAEIRTLKGYVLALKDASTFEQASELAFSFQHELAFISGNTLLPLIFSSFKAPVLSLWNRYCTLYGIETLYKNTALLCECLEMRDAQRAVESLTITIDDTIYGSRKIYY